MTGPRWPRTCSHPIYARTLTGVYQVVRMFSPCYFHVIISIGILESNSLSLSTPSRTKWTLIYLLMLYHHVLQTLVGSSESESHIILTSKEHLQCNEM